MAPRAGGEVTRAATGAAVEGRGKPGDQAIYIEVYDAILDHRLTPGTKLTEDSLSDIFGVSRTVVRKALHRLGHENIVRLRPNRGAVVASPSVEEARHVFEARRVIEDAVLRVATAAASSAQLDALRDLVLQERDAFERADRRAWIRLSGEFHLAIARAAGNAVLTEFLKELVSRTSLIIALYEAPGSAACASDEHLAIVDAMTAGGTDRAAALMEAHLRACEDRLKLEEGAPPIDLAQVFTGAPDRARD